MAPITTAIEVGRPAAEVFAYATDPSRTDPSGAPSMSQSNRCHDTRSRLTISIAFEGHGIRRLLVPLFVEREARKEMPDNLAALKERVEAAT
jgi:hypothetical protein